MRFDILLLAGVIALFLFGGDPSFHDVAIRALIAVGGGIGE